MTLLIELVRQQSDIVQETIIDALNKLEKTLGESSKEEKTAEADENIPETIENNVVDDETNDLDLFLYNNKIDKV